MKKITLLLILSLSTSVFFSQDRREELEKKREAAVNIYSFNDFGLSYKVGKEKKFWRFNILNIGFDMDNSAILVNTSVPPGYDKYSAFLSASVGREKRKVIREKINFVYGFDLILNYNFEQQNYVSHFLSGGVGGVFGIRYEINKYFYAGAEFLPSIMYNLNDTRNNTPTHNANNPGDLSFRLGSRSAVLNFGLKF